MKPGDVVYRNVCILFVMACFGAIELDLYQASANVFLLLLPLFSESGRQSGAVCPDPDDRVL